MVISHYWFVEHPQVRCFHGTFCWRMHLCRYGTRPQGYHAKTWNVQRANLPLCSGATGWPVQISFFGSSTAEKNKVDGTRLHRRPRRTPERSKCPWAPPPICSELRRKPQGDGWGGSGNCRDHWGVQQRHNSSRSSNAWPCENKSRSTLICFQSLL